MPELTGVSSIIRMAGERTLEVGAAVRRQLWRRQTVDESSRAIFIFGCNRSGTTMLTFQLGRSWRVVAFNENEAEAFSHFHLRKRKEIQALLDQRQAPRLLFKPVLDTYRAKGLLESFPGSHSLFAYRNVDDVVNSLIREAERRNHRPKRLQVGEWIASDFSEFEDLAPPLQTRERIRELWSPDLDECSAAALFWLFQNLLFFDLGLNNLPEVLLVRYERVVVNPGSEFKLICDFLGIERERRIGRGVYPDSVRKNGPPRIASRIRLACDELLDRLDSSMQDYLLENR